MINHRNASKNEIKKVKHRARPAAIVRSITDRGGASSLRARTSIAIRKKNLLPREDRERNTRRAIRSPSSGDSRRRRGDGDSSPGRCFAGVAGQLLRGGRIGCLTRAVSFRFGGGRWRLLRWSRAVWLRCIFEAAAPSHHRDHPG